MSSLLRFCLLSALLIPAGLAGDTTSKPSPDAKAAAPASPAAAQPAPAPRRWRLTLQTGFAETFQLTLGGVFGAGPAWQNKATVSVASVLTRGDSVSLSGWTTTDRPTRRNDWIAAAAYKYRPHRFGRQSLQFGGSVERWRFPSVLAGANDWVAGFNGAYSTRLGSVPFQLQSNVYRTITSTLKEGTLIYTQSWFDHPLVAKESVKLTLRHGPQHTYSWNFYGTNGHRVLRYAGALVLSAKATQVEAGYRPQYGLQRRIPDNHFWYAQISRTF